MVLQIRVMGWCMGIIREVIQVILDWFSISMFLGSFVLMHHVYNKTDLLPLDNAVIAIAMASLVWAFICGYYLFSRTYNLLKKRTDA